MYSYRDDPIGKPEIEAYTYKSAIGGKDIGADDEIVNGDRDIEDEVNAVETGVDDEAVFGHEGGVVGTSETHTSGFVCLLL